MNVFTAKNLGRMLLESLRVDAEFDTIVSMVRDNSRGNIYLIGGTVSRTINFRLYGVNEKDKDYDFIVDALNEDLIVPTGWEVSHHKFGNLTFKKGSVEVDIFPLSDQKYITEHKLKPTITHFLEGVPFSIQALAFDIKKEKLIGKSGIEALKKRIFKVHNIEAAQEMAKQKGISINERMLQKAKSMGFEIVSFD